MSGSFSVSPAESDTVFIVAANEMSSLDPSRLSQFTHLIAVGMEMTRKKNVKTPSTIWFVMSCGVKPAVSISRKTSVVTTADAIMENSTDRKIMMTPSVIELDVRFFFLVLLTVGITLFWYGDDFRG